MIHKVFALYFRLFLKAFRAENERATFVLLCFVNQTVPFELTVSLLQIETVARHFLKLVSALVNFVRDCLFSVLEYKYSGCFLTPKAKGDNFCCLPFAVWIERLPRTLPPGFVLLVVLDQLLKALLRAFNYPGLQ